MDESLPMAQQPGYETLPQETQDALGELQSAMDWTDQNQQENRDAIAAERQAWLDDAENWRPQDWIKYHEELPIPISADVAASPELESRLIRANELITGEPYIGEGGRSPEEIDADRREMLAAGATNPLEYIQQQEAEASPVQNLGLRTVQALGEGLVGGTQNTIQGLLGQSNAMRTSQAEAGWDEGVEQIKDKDSLIGEYMAGAVRGAAGSVGRVAPGLALSAITRDPRVAYAVLGGQAGVDAFAQKESEGWSLPAAALYGAAAGAVETASEVVGGRVAGGIGLTTAEEAFQGAAKKSLFAGVKNDAVRKAFEVAAGSVMEGGEEVLASKLHHLKDVMSGMPLDQIQTEDDLKAFLGGVLAGGAMNTGSAALNALTGSDVPQVASEEEVAPEPVLEPATPPEAAQEPTEGVAPPASEQATTPEPAPTETENPVAPGRAPDVPPPTSAEAPGPAGSTGYTGVQEKKPRKFRSSDKVEVGSIPDDLSVEVDAVRAKTGEKVKVSKPAREVISRLDSDISAYKKLINCLGK